VKLRKGHDGKLSVSLSALDIHKWTLMAQHIIARKDGRDLLCYHTLLRALREVSKRRAREELIKKEITELIDTSFRGSVQIFKEGLEDLMRKLDRDIRDFEFDEPRAPRKFNPATALELVRAKLIDEINETVLKPKGFVLQVSPDDRGTEPPLNVTFNRWTEG
jgi:hypothetical protein